MDYKDLVKNYPELGDILAEMQIDIEFLQNSLPYHKEEKVAKTVYQDMEWTARQWEVVEHLKAMVLNRDNKILAIMALLGITYDDESGALTLKNKPYPDKNVLILEG